MIISWSKKPRAETQEEISSIGRIYLSVHLPGPPDMVIKGQDGENCGIWRSHLVGFTGSTVF